ncbi:hypothetical protein KR222_010618, partial [Zaprionus bogoriensis]
ASMARKDDPVFNVKFVQLVEHQACLWNYTHPGYSKKEEVQRAWQHVANEIKDTVRNSRERWRTIRSSFLRSLKLARTQTGRGKRKYYLSKYLQFLIPYTKSRGCHRQQQQQLQQQQQHAAAAAGVAAAEQDEDTKDSAGSDCAAAEAQLLEVHVSEAEAEEEEHEPETPLRLQAIKVEQESGSNSSSNNNNNNKIVAAAAQHSLVALPASISAALRNNLDWTELTEWLKGSGSGSGGNYLQFQHLHSSSNTNSNSNMLQPHAAAAAAAATAPASAAATPPPLSTSASAPPPDADYSFLISLHPYLKEMSGKQNRRFRQKVVGLIDNVLDNVDV